jgi:type IV secretion system protein VirB11
MHDDHQESLKRLLEDLEDAYGETIQKARRNPECSDIAVNEDGEIWLTVSGRSIGTGRKLSENAARRIVSLVSDIDGRPVEKSALNANLPTGERFAALLPPTVSRIIFSIRLPPKKVFTLEDYVCAGIMTERQAALLAQSVAERLNILIVGGTGSGKSTLANALLAEDGFKRSRVCIIQDQDELRCSGANVVRAFTGVLSARDLVREFLRHNPDRIVIGEIRDGHAADEWIGASNTGHPGGLSTAHANSATEGLARIATLIGKVVENVPYTDIGQAVNVVAFIQGKGGARRLVEIVRPVGYDRERHRFLVEPVDERSFG